MTKDEQARARLVEIALQAADMWPHMTVSAEAYREKVRKAAGFKNLRTGSWCAAGLTAAMEDAGLVVPAPGTPARRGAVALHDYVAGYREGGLCHYPIEKQIELAMPGDVIAWLQHPKQSAHSWKYVEGKAHLFIDSGATSACRKANRGMAPSLHGPRCSSCVWYTRQGHVALVVGVAENSIWTVGWNEGAAPGRVMKRQLWRDPEQACVECYERGSGKILVRIPNTNRAEKRKCPMCKGTGKVPRSSTVLYRRPGGLYGIARPVAR